MSESVIPIIASIGGSFFTGIMIGYFVKKIIKILFFVVGGIVVLLLYLQQQGIISVNIEKLEGASTVILTLIASSFDKETQISDVTSLTIPLTGGLASGFAIGFMKG